MKNNDTCTLIGCTIRPGDCSHYKDEHLCSLQETDCEYAKQLNNNQDEELDQFLNIQYRIKEEGIAYCFKHYSSFSEINDLQFHILRSNLLSAMNAITQYIDHKVATLSNE